MEAAALLNSASSNRAVGQPLWINSNAPGAKDPWTRDAAFMEFIDQEFWPEWPRKQKKKAAIKTCGKSARSAASGSSAKGSCQQ
jgi:hypothetical protein